MSLNHSNSPMDTDPEEHEVEPNESAEESPEEGNRPFGHMTDKPGGEGGTAG